MSTPPVAEGVSDSGVPLDGAAAFISGWGEADNPFPPGSAARKAWNRTRWQQCADGEPESETVTGPDDRQFAVLALPPNYSDSDAAARAEIAEQLHALEMDYKARARPLLDRIVEIESRYTKRLYMIPVPTPEEPAT